ncbi:unnamed protein product, partial [Vitis vinifera]
MLFFRKYLYYFYNFNTLKKKNVFSLSTMEGKAKAKAEALAILFSFLLLSFFSFTGADKPLEYQSLVVRPLGENPTTKSQLSWTETETQISTLPVSETDPTMTMHLEHRDVLAFNATPEALFNLRLQRDAFRVEALSKMAAAAGGRRAGRNGTHAQGGGFSSSVTSGLAQGSGEYFTRLGVGTPPKYVYMVLDTGSDVVWIQCAPCRKCYSQTDPVFDPKKSGSFSSISCRSPLCLRLDSPGCNSRQSCLYQVAYGDGSFTFGEFSTETLTFRGTRVPKVALGCGHDNEGLFVGAAGLLGLGRQPRLNRPPVGGARVAGITASLFKLDTAGNGGVIIDSGTSVTRLTRRAYGTSSNKGSGLSSTWRLHGSGSLPAAAPEPGQAMEGQISFLPSSPFFFFLSFSLSFNFNLSSKKREREEVGFGMEAEHYINLLWFGR